MNRIVSGKGGASRPLAGVLALAVLAASLIVAVPDSANALTRRWERIEVTPYDQMGIPEMVGTNVRRGLTGLVDSVMQGAFSGFRILSPWGGFLVSKIFTVAGDLVGIVDNNIVTQHVFQGILSRQFLRFGVGAKGITDGLGVIHDTEFTGQELALDAYIGDETFHTDAWTAPGGIVTLGAVIGSNFVIRPIGSVITIFGARATGDSMHEYGKGLIESSLDVNFL